MQSAALKPRIPFFCSHQDKHTIKSVFLIFNCFSIHFASNVEQHPEHTDHPGLVSLLPKVFLFCLSRPDLKIYI